MATAQVVVQVVKKVQKANQRDTHAFQRLLGLAYGRNGKLKWELLEVCDSFGCSRTKCGMLKNLEPFLHSEGPYPDAIIHGKESSRPPVYSPELIALLTSPHSRTTKPLIESDIIKPRNLPASASPLSDDACIYGRLSKRREVNIRWRQFKTETKKLLPPLGTRAAMQDGKLQFPHKNLENLVDMESVVGELCRGPTETRREQKAKLENHDIPTPSMYRHPSRWVRRRYRWLLSYTPKIVYQSDKLLSIQKSPRSFSPYQKPFTYIPEADPTTLIWFRKPME